MSGESWAVAVGAGLIAAVGSVAALLAIPNLHPLAMVGLVAGAAVGLGLVAWGALSRGELSAPTLRDMPRPAGRTEIPTEAALPQSNSRSIAAAVFGDRVVGEEISQTGPGDTHVTLIISGSPIPQAHVDELLGMYQARYNRSFVDLTITSADRSVRARVGGEPRSKQTRSLPQDAISLRLFGDRARRETVIQDTISRHIRVELDMTGPPLIDKDAHTTCLFFKRRYGAPSIELVVTTDNQTNTYSG